MGSRLADAAVALILLASSLLAIGQVYRLTKAQWLYARDTFESVQAAIELCPENAEYRVRLASFLGVNGLPAISEAIRLNPGESMWRIEAAVLQEVSGDMEGAEASLVGASEVSRYYLPRMMLASFYFRQHNVPKFKEWAAKALRIGQTDPAFVYQMAVDLGIPLSEISQNLTPDRFPALNAWLARLDSLAEGKDRDVAAAALNEVDAVAARIIAADGRVYLDPLLATAEQLFRSGRISASASLWNALVGRGWLPRRKIDGDASGDLPLAESEFAAFDWQRFPIESVVFNETSTGGLSMRFSGQQPEQMILLARNLPLTKGRRYRIAARSSSENIGTDAGLVWRVRSGSSEPVIEIPALSANGLVQMDFATSPNPQPYRLEMWYSRRLGTTRTSGTVDVESVSVSALPN
jgi:hypothetical protein